MAPPSKVLRQSTDHNDSDSVHDHMFDNDDDDNVAEEEYRELLQVTRNQVITLHAVNRQLNNRVAEVVTASPCESFTTAVPPIVVSSSMGVTDSVIQVNNDVLVKNYAGNVIPTPGQLGTVVNSVKEHLGSDVIWIDDETDDDDVVYLSPSVSDLGGANTGNGAAAAASAVSFVGVSSIHAAGLSVPSQVGGGLAGAATRAAIHTRDIPAFKAFELRQSVDFSTISLDDIEQVPYMVRDRVSGVINQALEASPAGSILNVVLRGPSLAGDVQAILQSDDAYNTDLFMEQIAQVLQSNDHYIADEELEIVVTVAQNRQGGAGVSRKLGTIGYDEIISKKIQHLYNYTNRGNKLCFALCLAHFKDPKMTKQDTLEAATQIQYEAGFDSMYSVSFSDVSTFERLLDVKIVIFHHNTDTGIRNLQCFKTHDEPHPQTVWLYLYKDHYYMIENKKGFFGAAYMCNYCYSSYRTRMYHNCSQLCNVCYTNECQRHPLNTQKCSKCKRICKSQYCFEQHQRPDAVHSKIPCETMKYCDVCNLTYMATQKTHICKPPVCPHCREPVSGNAKDHQCFIQPVTAKAAQTNYILYDFETRYHNGKHEANYVCAMDINGSRFGFPTMKCVDTFVKRYRQPKYKGYTFIAHNASGFDNYILLEYFVKQNFAPSVTMRGSRVILMYDSQFQQRWIDSFSFLPMRLAKTPEALGFDDLAKGYFPHKFNTRAHETYIGKYPDPSYYGYSEMSDADKTVFMRWYETKRDKTFNLETELGVYCTNDVELLRRACTTYRESFMECTQLDPFSFTTLASSCMGVFKTLFLPKDTVALTYEGAYIQQNKDYSDVSMQWLEYLAHTENIEIKHALNHGEEKFGRLYVDGYNSASNTCYEFAGCFFHGCVKCHVQSNVHPCRKGTYGDQYKEFTDRLDVLRNQHSLNVVVLWECEWTSLKQTNPEVQAFMATYKKRVRLDPREALFGGRTNAIKLYHKVDGDEKIRYYDFTSLYPTVQATKNYPVGHPVIIFKDFDSVDNYFGFVKCTVLPPKGVFHPVLPFRCNGKLMFPLCRTCAITLNQTTDCTHSDKDRQLSGVWVSFELQKAIEKGYQIVAIDEVWHFPDKTDKLFRGYVNTFLKCKQEASGYPGNIKTPSEQEKYVKDYFEKEGIQLDPAKIRVNKAMRSCNKLLLNSLWGRFSMRSNMASCELIIKPDRFTQLMFSDHYDVRQFCFISDEVAMVQWRYVDGRASRVKDVNVFIGAMTTAYARLMLYDVLETLEERVLYCDTDSIIFTAKSGEVIPPLGAYLGDLTDELNSGDVCGLPQEDYITEFVSGGPKCYAYNTKQGKTTVKCKGVTLNARNAAVVTPESLAKLVHAFVANQNTDTPPLMTVYETIRRDKKHFHLKNDTVLKKVRVVYNKRRLLPDYTTLPYGY